MKRMLSMLTALVTVAAGLAAGAPAAQAAGSCPKTVVVVDHHLDRQVVPDRGEELGHQHGGAAVADERDHLPARIPGLIRDGERSVLANGDRSAGAGCG